jgi:hypothetical protein
MNNYIDTGKINYVTALILFIIYIPSSFNQEINFYSLYVLVPVVFLISLHLNRYKLIPNIYFQIFVLLFLWMLVTVVPSGNLELAFSEIKKICGVIIFCFVISVLTRNKKYLYWFYFLYIVKFFFIFFYAINNLGLLTVDTDLERFASDELNANMFGYFSFFAMFSAFILSESFLGWKKNIFKIILFFIIVLSFYLALITASRQIIVITFFLLAGLFIVKYLVPINAKSFLLIGIYRD